MRAKDASYYSRTLRIWAAGAFLGSDVIREAADLLDSLSRENEALKAEAAPKVAEVAKPETAYTAIPAYTAIDDLKRFINDAENISFSKKGKRLLDLATDYGVDFEEILEQNAIIHANFEKVKQLSDEKKSTKDIGGEPLYDDVEQCIDRLRACLTCSPAPDHITVDRETIGLAIRKLATVRMHETALNDRASVETLLFDIAAGKRPPLTAEECREAAIKLGIPKPWRLPNNSEPTVDIPIREESQ